MSAMPRSLPSSFWWGTAASSTQVDGSAPASDYRRWEGLGKVPPSGDGNGFTRRYAEDFALFAEHGLTQHRLSLEWARLEPVEGKHDDEAVEHARSVLTAARDAGLEPWVCLHHFSLPGWFSDDMGGFVDERARTYHWPRHVAWVAETFGDLAAGWKPINEPVAYAAAGWLLGVNPPGAADLNQFLEALEATHLANHEAWRQLRGGDQPVATIMDLSPLVAGTTGDDPDEAELARAALDVVDDVSWGSWIRALRDGVLHVPGRSPIEIDDMAGSFDLIGFSYYSGHQVMADTSLKPYPPDRRLNDVGEAPWPEGLGIVIRRLADELPGRALLVCEHGVGTDDDEWRTALLDEALEQVADAVDDGIDVRGFFHWTGVDNYEWAHGYDVRFGLFDTDRRPKGSAALAKAWATAARSD
jgi:beta-glucosidase